MSRNNMSHYRDALRHVVRPESSTERASTPSATLADYEALYLYNSFVEYSSYEAETDTEENIALGYAEYIDRTVRDEGKGLVELYAHTPTAKDVLEESIQMGERYGYEERDIQAQIEETIGGLIDE